MKIFLDTAEVNEIKRAAALGVLDGVTTNPTLLKETGRDLKETIHEICDILPHGAISAEVTEENCDGMLKQAREFATWHQAVVIKIPMTEEGIKAVRILTEEGIRVNVTLVFSVTQALIAAKAGATYVSPFVGRLDDIAIDGMGLISDIITVFNNYSVDTEIIVASVRHLGHVVTSASLGADIVTMPPKIFWQMLASPLTDMGVEKFMKDAGKR